MKTVYLDTCCYGRPYDDRSQTVIVAETTAIMNALNICAVEGFPVIGSPTVVFEINNIKSDVKRRQVMGFYTKTITAETPLTAGAEARAGALAAQGMGKIDAYHAALSENAGVDILLTTDNQFESAAARLNVKTKVINPVNFLKEYMKWLQPST